MIGTSPPPISNQPNRDGQDPHELPRRTLAEQQMSPTSCNVFGRDTGPGEPVSAGGPESERRSGARS